jgi:OmpA family protein
MHRLRAALPIALALVMSACATVPTGPSVMVLPGTDKSFEQFQTDDAGCRQWAMQQTGTTPGQSAMHSTGVGAVLGTLLGAGAGAAIGAAAGSPATGAAVGAASGLLGGTVIGAGQGEAAGATVQGRFDAAYIQCMYAKGHQVPLPRGARPYAAAPAPGYAPQASPGAAPAPPQGALPPPPAGTPPPPPPGVR